MAEAVGDGCAGDAVPRGLHHMKRLSQVDGLWLIVLCTAYELPDQLLSVVDLKRLNDACVHRLNVGRCVGWQEVEGNVRQLNLSHRMAGSIIDQKDDLPVGPLHLAVEFFQPVLEQERGHPGFLVRSVAHVRVRVVRLAEASRPGHLSDHERLDLHTAGSVCCQGDGDAVLGSLHPLHAAGGERRVWPKAIEEAGFVEVEHVFWTVRSKDPLQIAPSCRDRTHVCAVCFSFVTLSLYAAPLLEALQPTSGEGEVGDVELFPKDTNLFPESDGNRSPEDILVNGKR